jgi:deoxyhypusine synthase
MKSNSIKINAETNASAKTLKSSEKYSGPSIEGYDFNYGVDYKKILQSFSTTGYQASNFSRAVEVINKMISNKATIFLGYTSSMVSSGLRDVFRFLVEHKKVNFISTTAGGVEEDIMKCLGDFYLGDFSVSGKELYEKGLNRIGNIFVPNERYMQFEDFIQPILQELYEKQLQTKKITTPSELIWKLGEKINNKKSICYWAWKNKIKIFCPAITDGAIGGNIYFFKFKHPEFAIDIAEDNAELNNSTIGLKKSGVIILGSGLAKHSILQANLFRNGADYAVYINNAQEFDGSDAGASPEEAVSWGKIKGENDSVKVFGDATIIFPLIVSSTFA